MNLKELVRENIWKLKPYSSARHEFTGEASVYLDANENPYGGACSRYPDPNQKRLKEVVAIHKEVCINQIFLGNGSDEAIDLLIRIFCRPARDKIMILPPTYGMYKVCADLADVGVVEAELKGGFMLDVDQIRRQTDQSAKLLFICSPNNPTGNLMSREDIVEILDFFRGIVVIDEAYQDFSDQQSWIAKINDFPNLVVLQTMSKAWGLAGIRLGQAFAQKEIINLLNKVKPPYNVNELSQQAAIAALLVQHREKEKHVIEIKDERQRVRKALEQHDLVEKIFDSHANFLLVKFKQAAKVFLELREKGIIVRDRSNLPLCENCLRITVGTPSENDFLLEQLNAMT